MPITTWALAAGKNAKDVSSAVAQSRILNPRIWNLAYGGCGS